MKVSYYCQHVLGIGHFQRSLEICKAIAKTSPTTLILGGPQVQVSSPGVKILQLPGLKMDNNFENLQPCDQSLALDQAKTQRVEALFTHFTKTQPDVFITELYPFGRKAFRFELDPILAAIKSDRFSECLCICSVRDILVEKSQGREKFEKRVVNTLNSYFDGILVHSDPMVIKLDETFSLMRKISPPVHYTGYVTNEPARALSTSPRTKVGINSSEKLIVASIGGGNVGYELLSATLKAVKILQADTRIYLQIFCGPYCDDLFYGDLKEKEDEFIRVNRFTKRFPEWLQAADLSISMAGYNTCMNLSFAGIPCIVYPFNQNREQRLRAERLGMFSPLDIIDETPTPDLLITKIRSQLQLRKTVVQIDLDGAQNSANQVKTWFQSMQSND